MGGRENQEWGRREEGRRTPRERVQVDRSEDGFGEMTAKRRRGGAGCVAGERWEEALIAVIKTKRM